MWTSSLIALAAITLLLLCAGFFYTTRGVGGLNELPGLVTDLDAAPTSVGAIDANLRSGWQLRTFADWLGGRPLAFSAQMEALGASLAAFVPSFSSSPTVAAPEVDMDLLLAQTEAIVHKPVGFSSSPSLPGVINAPWWTDFAHLVYWFYFVATFTTVAFLGYLYDLKVRRVETAHPIRETRGFSRAQTGDLITAVLPLTWSATMVMHASTHSINFDENTAGTTFSLTVIAYQWGWNYYFPRDIIAQFEAAPRLVGRGRVVSFEVTNPVDAVQLRHLDSWALRALVGGRHGSRTGRLNAQPALALVLPTDLPAGITTAGVASWRESLNRLLSDTATAPVSTNSASPLTTHEPVALGGECGFDTPTLFRARPTVFIAGNRLSLGHRHFSPRAEVPSFAAMTWLAAGAVTHAGGSLAPLQSAALPAAANITAHGSECPLGGEANSIMQSADLNYLRGPSHRPQHVLWAGADATTGAGATTLGTSEDHGWLSPVTAREALLRSALAVRAGWEAHASASAGLPTTVTACPLLLPFDVNARVLMSHPTGGELQTPPTAWACAAVAIESEIEAATAGLWVNALIPDASITALGAPVSLLGRQSPVSNLTNLLRVAAPTHVITPAPLFQAAALAAVVTKPRLSGAATAFLDRLKGRPSFPSRPQHQLTLPTPLSQEELNSQARADTMARLKDMSRPWGMYIELSEGRLTITPSMPGMGLDESRLVRTGLSRLLDPILVSSKLDGLGSSAPRLPAGPVSLLGTGWSSSASLTSYPSYKLTRGAVLRRPHTGGSSTPAIFGGLKEPLSAPSLSKLSTPLALPALALVKSTTVPFRASAPSLDTQIGGWSGVWPVATPVPTGDLDPAFINTAWSLEANTTRRSDHNSRYLVSWSPLAAAVSGSPTSEPTLVGPLARAALSSLQLRSSVLALNELGLKNTFGLTGVRPRLLSTSGSATAAAGRISTILDATDKVWAPLWASLPAWSTNPATLVNTSRTPAAASGRAAVVLTLRGGLAKPITAITTAALGVGSPLVDALARAEYSMLGDSGEARNAKQGFVPLSSSISSSRRLRVTKGITLPSDTPMHIICGSKDVIHSWAIPGLGVKIDCIPGYNSHRRLLLRWRGAYWGQCMEVCGRYHHWMPIMINVTHPALFLDWCLSFLRGVDSQAPNGGVGPTAAEIGSLLKLLGA